jgi:hypothetical protein
MPKIPKHFPNISNTRPTRRHHDFGVLKNLNPMPGNLNRLALIPRIQVHLATARLPLIKDNLMPQRLQKLSRCNPSFRKNRIIQASDKKMDFQGVIALG